MTLKKPMVTLLLVLVLVEFVFIVLLGLWVVVSFCWDF